jgi:hypothetical protein
MQQKTKKQQADSELEDTLQSNSSQGAKKTIVQLLTTKDKEIHKLWLNGQDKKQKISSIFSM